MWLDLLDPDDAALAEALPPDVHSMVTERLGGSAEHDDEPRPRLEMHGNYLFGVLVMPLIADDDDICVAFQPIGVVVTHERIVTVRKTPPDGPLFDLTAVRRGAIARE